jgi:hypothetical protein
MDHGRKKMEKMETLHLRKESLKKKPVFFRQARSQKQSGVKYEQICTS